MIREIADASQIIEHTKKRATEMQTYQHGRAEKLGADGRLWIWVSNFPPTHTAAHLMMSCHRQPQQ